MLYLLYGTESLLIKEFINNIKIENNIDNIITYNMLENTLEEVINEANYIDMFNDKKIIVVNNSNFFTTELTINTDILENYLENINVDTILIFVVNKEKLDVRKKIVKKFKDKNLIKEFNRLSSTNLLDKINDIFKEDDYSIDIKSINELINRCSEDYYLISNEIKKLKLYKIDNKKISFEDICEAVSKPLEDDIFKLIDSVSKKDSVKIMKLYKDIIDSGEDPIKILVLLANQFRLMYQVYNLNNFTESKIANILQVHPYRVKLAREKNLNFRKENLEKILKELSLLDYNIKSGKIDKYAGLELFLMNF